MPTYSIANVNVPLLNPVRFVPTDSGERWFDAEWFYKQQYEWQDRQRYYQKWQKSDAIMVQVVSNYLPPIKVVDCWGRKIEDVTVIKGTGNYNGLSPYNGTIDLSAYDEGVYYIDIDGRFISEPQEVMTTQPNTYVCTYGNSTNNFGVFFNNGKKFKFRCEANLIEFSPKAKDVMFEDQILNNTILSSSPYRTFTLYLGAKGGIPDWVADKVNRMLSCTDFWFDGKKFVKDDGAAWEATRESNLWAMAGWAITLREQQERDLYFEVTTFDPKKVVGVDWEVTEDAGVTGYKVTGGDDFGIGVDIDTYTL